ncbi:MAG: hypothetical protein R3F59_06610 [Myxococcota bacterium]
MTGVGSSPATPAVDRTFAGELSSVAVIDPATGLPSERVWVMRGRATASSVGNMQGYSLFYSGKVRRLGANEAVSLGTTEVVAQPGETIEGVGVWTPISAM